jgi:hypothetical protein
MTGDNLRFIPKNNPNLCAALVFRFIKRKNPAHLFGLQKSFNFKLTSVRHKTGALGILACKAFEKRSELPFTCNIVWK